MSVARRVLTGSRRGLGRAVSRSLARTPAEVARRSTIDPHWRRLDDGHAVRLSPRETITVTNPVGRWRKVDPRVPQDRWRGWSSLLALGLWGSAVGVGWWIGSSRGRGPLASVAELDRFGGAITWPHPPTPV